MMDYQLKSFSMLYLLNLYFNCFCKCSFVNFSYASFLIRMDYYRQSTTCKIRIRSSSRDTRTPYRKLRIISPLRLSSSATLNSPSSYMHSRSNNRLVFTLSTSFSTADLNSLKASSVEASFLKLSARALVSFSIFLNRQYAMYMLFPWSTFIVSRIIWLSVEHLAWFLSNSQKRLLLSFLAYCSFLSRLFWLQLMLVLMLAEGYFSSNPFTGDRFFIRNCLFSSYLLTGPLSCLPTFGEVA